MSRVIIFPIRRQINQINQFKHSHLQSKDPMKVMRILFCFLDLRFLDSESVPDSFRDCFVPGFHWVLPHPGVVDLVGLHHVHLQSVVAVVSHPGDELVGLGLLQPGEPPEDSPLSAGERRRNPYGCLQQEISGQTVGRPQTFLRHHNSFVAVSVGGHVHLQSPGWRRHLDVRVSTPVVPYIGSQLSYAIKSRITVSLWHRGSFNGFLTISPLIMP